MDEKLFKAVMLSTNQAPDELVEYFHNFVKEIAFAIDQIIPEDERLKRLFVGAFGLVYTALVVDLIKEGKFDLEKYLIMEMEVFIRNARNLFEE